MYNLAAQSHYIGNLNSLRDCGHARDYVEMLWLMLQQESPEDYVIATGEQHSVREFIEMSAKELGIFIEWKGEGAGEIGVNSANGATIVAVDPNYFRPTEVETLLSDPSKAKQKLGWSPKIYFEELVREIVQTDMEEAKKDQMCQQAGFTVKSHLE